MLPVPLSGYVRRSSTGGRLPYQSCATRALANPLASQASQRRSVSECGRNPLSPRLRSLRTNGAVF